MPTFGIWWQDHIPLSKKAGRPVVKRLLAIGVLAMVCLSPELATAQAKRVTVLEFSGRGAGPVRNHVVKALVKQSGDVELVPSREVENAANRLGISLSAPEDYASVAGELSIDAFVEGELSRSGGRWEAMVYVRDGATGEVVGQEPWARRKKGQLKAIRKNFWKILGPAITNSSAPALAAEPLPEPVEQTSDVMQPEFEEKEEKSSSPSTSPAFLARIGVGLMWRNYSYNDLRGGDLRDYSNALGSPAIAPAIDLELYPFAFGSDGAASDLGIGVDFDYALGLKSKEGNAEYTTTAYELNLMLLYRIPLGVFVPQLGVGYMAQVFDADLPDAILLPAMEYSALRAHLAMGMNFTDAFGLEVTLGYAFVLDAGEIMTDVYFPEATAGTFFAGLASNIWFTDSVGMRLAIDWKRYFFDFKYSDDQLQPGSPPAPRKIAGGVTDDYTRFTLSFAYKYGGASSDGE